MKNVQTNNLVEYQQYFESLYGKINDSREWEEIFGYLSRTTGYLTRAVLKKNATTQDFVRPLSWLFALASKADVCLQESFLKKFPELCPYCLEKPCCCFKTGKKPRHEIAPFRQREELVRYYDGVSHFGQKDFSWCIRNISGIYPNNEVIWHFSGPWMNCSKLFEEVAELHEAFDKFKINQKPITEVEEEFADVLAWILSTWVGVFEKKSLDDEIKSYFYDACPVCKQDQCACKKGDARIQGLVDPEKFGELRILFEELEGLSPNAQGDLQELITSLKDVEEKHSEVIATTTVKSVEEKFNTFRDKLGTTEDVTKKLASIAKALAALGGYVS